jgi:small basic protein
MAGANVYASAVTSAIAATGAGCALKGFHNDKFDSKLLSEFIASSVMAGSLIMLAQQNSVEITLAKSLFVTAASYIAVAEAQNVLVY